MKMVHRMMHSRLMSLPKRLTVAVGSAVGLVLLAISYKCFKLVAYHWWAADFPDSAGRTAHQSAGNWCFAAAVTCLVVAVLLLGAAACSAFKPNAPR